MCQVIFKLYSANSWNAYNIKVNPSKKHTLNILFRDFCVSIYKDDPNLMLLMPLLSGMHKKEIPTIPVSTR